MNNRENFVYRIMQLQKQNNLNDHELSRLLGYKANNMNKIINFVSLPRMEKFFELCDFFNISPEEFFRYNDEEIQNGLTRLLKGCKISMKKNAK